MEETYIVHLAKRKHDVPRDVPPSSPEVPDSVNTPPAHTPPNPSIRGTAHYKHPVVVHITDHELFILRLENTDELKHFGKKTLPEGVVEDGIILNPEVLAQTIRRTIQDTFGEEGIPKTIHGFVCIPKSQTYTKHFVLTHTDLPLTHEIVLEKLSHLLPFSMSNVKVSFTHWTSGDEQHIVAVVIPTTVLTSYMSTLELAQITPTLLDVEAAALGRALIPKNQNARTLVVDVGARSTALNSYIGHELITSVFAPIGSDKLIEVLQKTQTTNNKEVRSTFEDIANTLTQAITLIKQDFENIPGTSKIETIYLVGQTFLLPILTEYLEKEVGIHTEIGNPLQHLTSYPPELKQDAVLYASAIGLALRTDTSDATGFNFSHSHHTTKKQKVRAALLQPFMKEHVREFFLLLLVLVSFAVLFLVLY